ncbi:MAG: hypothetical protein WC124_01545 [Desulfoplanes sp.]|nr:hypothetical protein [Desulfoplanes sp.]
MLTTTAVIKAVARLISLLNRVKPQPKYATITGRRTGLRKRLPMEVAT